MNQIRISKRTVSVFLTVVMAFSLMFGMTINVNAAGKTLAAGQSYYFGDTITVGSSRVYYYDDDEYPDEYYYLYEDTTYELCLECYDDSWVQWFIYFYDAEYDDEYYLDIGYGNPEINAERVPTGIICTGGDGSEENPFTFDLIYGYGSTGLSPEQLRQLSIRTFVETLYVNALGRTYDLTGRDYWVGELNKGASATSVVTGFINSPEFIGKDLDNAAFVNLLYKVFFNRTPSAAEASNWVGALEGGASRTQIINEFAKTPEWANTCAFYNVVP